MRPPRILKAPTSVWFSCFTQTSAPARCERSGQRICGVGATMGRMRSAAASIAARSGNLFVTALTGSGIPASDSRQCKFSIDPNVSFRQRWLTILLVVAIIRGWCPGQPHSERTLGLWGKIQRIRNTHHETAVLARTDAHSQYCFVRTRAGRQNHERCPRTCAMVHPALGGRTPGGSIAPPISYPQAASVSGGSGYPSEPIAKLRRLYLSAE